MHTTEKMRTQKGEQKEKEDKACKYGKDERKEERSETRRKQTHSHKQRAPFFIFKAAFSKKLGILKIRKF